MPNCPPIRRLEEAQIRDKSPNFVQNGTRPSDCHSVPPNFPRHRFYELGCSAMSIRVLCKVSIALTWMLVPLPIIAQTTGSIPPGKASDPSQEEPPPGGCMPIGITAAGETVFPFVCKSLIEAAKGKTSEITERGGGDSKPLANAAAAPLSNVTIAPAVGAVAAPLVKESGAPSAQERVVRPDEPVSPRAEEPAVVRRDQRPPRRAAAPPNCVHSRSFDSVTGTYRDFDGTARPCTPGR